MQQQSLSSRLDAPQDQNLALPSLHNGDLVSFECLPCQPCPIALISRKTPVKCSTSTKHELNLALLESYPPQVL